MTEPHPTIFWDFDGTLVLTPKWSTSLVKALDILYPGHDITREKIRIFLQEGFPWHTPERHHPELCEPGNWWSYAEALLARAYQKVGLSESDSQELSQIVHELSLQPGQYRLFEDTLPALQRLSEAGWRHIVLSNHIPELSEMIDNLPIRSYIESCVCSAVTGYEKPHPKSFALALEQAGHPEKVWMVGDNLTADVRGAEAVDIPAILVRQPPTEAVNHFAKDLLETASIIEDSL